jgi:hypothetical protein
MATSGPPSQVVMRLRRVESLHSDLRRRLELDLNSAEAEPEFAGLIERMLELVGSQQREIAAVKSQRSVETSETGAKRANDGAARGSLSDVLEGQINAVDALITAYGALYATGRLLYEADFCDRLASEHALAWRDRLDELEDLLPELVIRELVADGLTCRCVCPACGRGACLCMRNSIDTIRDQHHRPGLEPTEGIALRIPPRPGSQLAEAGMQAGDVVVAIDAEVVRTNGELQQALRRRPMGEPATARVIREGAIEEIALARVSDLPGYS